MRILLDTHIALWAIADTAKLSKQVISLLEQKENESLNLFTRDAQFPYYGEACVVSI